MRDEIREKLDQIDELFPPERLESSKARMRAMRANERPADRYPFILSPLGFDYYDDVMPREKRLDAMLDEIIAHGRTQDDFIPHFFPGCRVATIPNMFGAKERTHTQPDGRVDYGVCEAMFSAGDDPSSLPDPSIDPDSIAAWWLDMQEYVLEETDGRLPISVIDMQGPMDVAAQLWGYDNLFLDAMTDGKKSRALLEKCTTAFIELWRRQQGLLGDLFVGTHLWGWSWIEQGANHGASLSMDCLAMISAEFFTEHTREHLVRVSEAFGGLAIHSCGNFSATTPGITGIPGIHTINAGQMSLGALLQAGIDPERFLTLSRNYDNIEEECRLIKAERLNVEMTVCGVWPEYGKAMSRWSESEWDAFRQRESRILELVSVN